MDAKLKNKLKKLNFNFDQVQSDSMRDDVNLLINGFEEFSNENNELLAEIQHLKDEINRLQGEQGKPDI